MKMMPLGLEIIADSLLDSHDLHSVNLIWQNYYTNGKLPGATSKGSGGRDILKLVDTNTKGTLQSCILSPKVRG